MTIGPVTFYSMRGSLSSGEYPLFANGQDLSSYIVEQKGAVKYSKDVQQSITVPEFIGYETVNVVEMGGLYYWATSFRESTISQGSITYTLSLMAPTSFIKTGDTITASWKKTPILINRYLQQVISNDCMGTSRSIEIGAIPVRDSDPSVDAVFWVEVSGIAYYDGTGDIAGLDKWGFFIPYSAFNNLSVVGREYCQCDNETAHFPTLLQVLEDPTILRESSTYILLAENILSISVSYRCPYSIAYSNYTQSGEPTYAYRLDYSGPVTTLYNQSNVCAFHLYGPGALQPVDEMATPDPGEVYTMTLTDMERVIGRTTIKDQNDNDIFNIDHGLLDSNTIQVTVRTHTDITGIYTDYIFGSQTVTVPEGHLPYFGDVWKTYQAYKMNYDREAYQNNAAFDAQQFAVNENIASQNTVISNLEIASSTLLNSNLWNMGITPAAAGAVDAMKLLLETNRDQYERGMNYVIETGRNAANYQLTQKQARSGQSPVYNTGYGLVYLFKHSLRPMRIALSMPKNMTTTYYNDWMELYGYACEGKADVTAQKGYYQGTLLNDGTIVGKYFDELNRQFIQGFRFITLS